MEANGLLLVGGVVVLVPGLLVLMLGVFQLMRTFRFLQTAAETTGTIVDLLSGLDGWSAVVEFKVDEGQTIRWTESSESRPPSGKIGDEIPMKYSPKNPTEARIARGLDVWALGGILSLVGLIMCGTGVLLLILGL